MGWGGWKKISNAVQGVANVATAGVANNAFSKDSQKAVAPVVQTTQAALALPFSIATGGLSNKLLPKGTQESPAGQAATKAGEIVAVGTAAVVGGYALAGGFAGVGGAAALKEGRDLIPKGAPSPAPTIIVDSARAKNDYTIPLIIAAVLIGSKML